MAQKLYTEEQVRQAIKMADKYHHVLDSEETEIVSILEPIELPSDEEIIEVADDYSDTDFKNPLDFLEGAQWMRDKILNK